MNARGDSCQRNRNEEGQAFWWLEPKHCCPP
jgi:hypothetical protein